MSNHDEMFPASLDEPYYLQALHRAKIYKFWRQRKLQDIDDVLELLDEIVAVPDFDPSGEDALHDLFRRCLNLRQQWEASR